MFFRRSLTAALLSPSLAACMTVPLGLTGCVASDDDPSEDVAENEGALLSAHVYRKPALPTANYEPPTSNVIFVAPSGNDGAAGTLAAPLQTLARAVTAVNAKAAGPTWTIVLRGGTYREGELTVTRSNVTIQRYRTEAVSLLGSTRISNFTGSGPYTATITTVDPTRVEQNCAEAGLLAGNRHFGSETAISVTRAGVPLQRVATGSTPGAGQYTYDPGTNRLTVRDSATEIEFASKLWALRTKASNVKFAGLDIENYGTCTVNWSKTVGANTYYNSAVLIYKDTNGDSSSTLENSTVANNSAGGVNVARAFNVKLTGNVVVNNGWTGLLGGWTNGIVLQGNSFSYNNFKRWGNSADAGVKLTHAIDGVVVDNLFEHNAATGFWCDQGCGASNPGNRWFTIARNVIGNNDEKGIFYEVSRHGVIASNVIHDNGQAGIASFGTRNMRIWNNTAVDNNTNSANYLANISVVDDNRCFSGDTLPGGKSCVASNGVDPLASGNWDDCEPSSVGALANTCNSELVTLSNNIISGSGIASRPLLNVSIPARTYGAALAVTASDYQAYYRSNTSSPSTLIAWQRDAAAAPISYASLAAFKSAIASRDANSVERSGGSTHPFFVDYGGKNFAQNTSNGDVWGRGATLPSEVLKAVYWPATAPAQPPKRIGAIDWRGKGTTTEPTPPSGCTPGSAVYHVENATNLDHLYTLSASERSSAIANYGYVDRGTAFGAFGSADGGHVPVYRLANTTTRDRLFTTSSTEAASAKANYGYVDEGIGFYADAAAGECRIPIVRLVKGSNHVFAASTSERQAYVAAGFTDEGVRFYATTAP